MGKIVKGQNDYFNEDSRHEGFIKFKDNEFGIGDIGLQSWEFSLNSL